MKKRIRENKDILKTMTVFYLVLAICTLFVVKCNEPKEKNSTNVQENAIFINK